MGKFIDESNYLRSDSIVGRKALGREERKIEFKDLPVEVQEVFEAITVSMGGMIAWDWVEYLELVGSANIWALLLKENAPFNPSGYTFYVEGGTGSYLGFREC
jgi:hypothetical protein